MLKGFGRAFMKQTDIQPQEDLAGSGAPSNGTPFNGAPWSAQPASAGLNTPQSVPISADGPPATEQTQDSPEATEDDAPSASWLILRELAETIVLSLIIFLLMRQVVQNYRIESHSMEPNFSEGQFILVNKLAYVLGEPKQGDVLVFHNPNNTEEDYIKRIIGLPGDTLSISESRVYINGEPLDETYIAYDIRPTEQFGPIVIEPNHLFVMGDNRPNSSDSRRFGQLSQDLIVGKAWLRVWPPDKWGLISHIPPLRGAAASAP
jgi:signal peptidase I